VHILLPLQTANVDYFLRKTQLSRFSAYPDSLPSQLIGLGGVVLYTYLNLRILTVCNICNNFIVQTMLFKMVVNANSKECSCVVFVILNHTICNNKQIT
jgi:hypothetical protein